MIAARIGVGFALASSLTFGCPARGEPRPATPVDRQPATERVESTSSAAESSWSRGAVVYGVYPPLYGDPPLRAVVDAFAHWVQQYEVDGFRVDVAWGIRHRNPGLWSQMLTELRQLDPELWFLAEASARDGYYVDNGFDASYDWTEQVGRWAWEDLFEDPDQIGPRLDVVLEAGPTPSHRVARFLNNNDTGERFVTRHGPELTRVAATLLLTLPGIPVLYTGDEVGAEYLPYAVEAPLTWDDPYGLRPTYERLIDLRERLPGLAAPSTTPVRTDRASAYAYLRHEEDGSDAVLVVLEFGDGGPVELSFETTPEAFAGRGALQDRLRDAVVRPRWTTPTSASLDLPPTTAMILQPMATDDAPS